MPVGFFGGWGVGGLGKGGSRPLLSGGLSYRPALRRKPLRPPGSRHACAGRSAGQPLLGDALGISAWGARLDGVAAGLSWG